MRRLIPLAAVASVLSLAAVPLTAVPAAGATGPSVSSNALVDLDHGLAFPRDKQNEQSITRDPLTGVLVAGANDEISQPACAGTSTPLASPCPFAPGAPTSAYYYSTDNGRTWAGGYLPGFGALSPPRTSGGDPSLSYGPRRCASGAFSFSCGAVIYYGSLADPVNEFAGEQVTVSGRGTVEVFWTENADSKKVPSLQVVAVSADGGQTFSAPVTIAQVTDYPLTGTPFDVVDLFNRVPGMSARVDCYPHPAADPPSARVYVVWCDFSGGHGVVKGAVSLDGIKWTQLGTIASVSGRNAFFPEASVAPNGIVSLTFDALTQPPANNLWQTGVQVYDNYFAESPSGGLAFSAPMRVSTASSNPDGSSYNNLQEQFIGDYISIVAGPTSAYLVWTDARSATVCQAVDNYRNAVYAGSKTAVAPNPDSACATSFGNTDTFAAIVTYMSK